MNKIFHMIRAVASALGWLILGGVLMLWEIGPWWLGWVPFAISLCAIVAAIDKALEPRWRWRV